MISPKAADMVGIRQTRCAGKTATRRVDRESSAGTLSTRRCLQCGEVYRPKKIRGSTACSLVDVSDGGSDWACNNRLDRDIRHIVRTTCMR